MRKRIANDTYESTHLFKYYLKAVCFITVRIQIAARQSPYVTKVTLNILVCRLRKAPVNGSSSTKCQFHFV